MTVELRPETPDDRAAIRAVNEAAFETPQEADLIDALRRDGDLVLSLVAAAGGAIVGHVGFSRMQVGGDAVAPAVALAPVAVHPAHQRRGVGTALISDGLARLTQAGETLVFVLGEPDYYGRFGFSAAPAARFDTPYPGPYFQSLALSPHAPVSGAVRYARAFAALS